jgi:hypothetical protein
VEDLLNNELLDGRSIIFRKISGKKSGKSLENGEKKGNTTSASHPTHAFYKLLNIKAIRPRWILP